MSGNNDDMLINTVDALDERQSRPPAELVAMLRRLDGDVLVLGAGGKMGPTLAVMAKRATIAAGVQRRIVAVSRFSDANAATMLQGHGVEVVRADLRDAQALEALPDFPNIVYLAGRKFGSAGNAPLTWAMNTLLPGLVLNRFRRSRFVVLSTGNVYPFVPVDARGCAETHRPDPVGEYAQSCLGRERIVQYFASEHRTPVSLIRLNYAIDCRYGVLLDIAARVFRGEPVQLTMGFVNVIWQADASAAALLALEHSTAEPFILNVTGRDILSVRSLAGIFAELFDREAVLAGTESDTALLSDASLFHSIFRFEKMKVEEMCRLVAHWIRVGGPVWNKATHFETRDGAF